MWVDSDFSGNWEDPEEKLVNSQQLQQGTNTVTFQLPQLAVGGITYMRARISTLGNLKPTGEALDGEVEDYRIYIQNDFMYKDFFSLGKYYNTIKAGDYDGDGDLDVLIFGDGKSDVIKNNGGQFTRLNLELPIVNNDGSCDWLDIDNDNDLDLILAGVFASPKVRIYRNDAGVLNDVSASMPELSNTSNVSGDFDNDGDIDILIYGQGTSGYLTKVYQNQNADYSDTQFSFPGLAYIPPTSGKGNASKFGDYDNDGDLDVLMTGNNSSENVVKIFKNNGSTFNDTNISLPFFNSYAVDWSDLDGDGDLDLIIAGDKVVIFKYQSGQYQHAFTISEDIFERITSVVTADYDNDGDMDLALKVQEHGQKVYIYDNNNLNFTQTHQFPRFYNSNPEWGDFDNDGDMDILMLFDADDNDGAWLRLLENKRDITNKKPATPGGLNAQPGLDNVTLSWDKATDTETPQNGLTYNLRVGTTPSGTEILSPLAELSSGKLRILKMGNVNQNNSWSLKNLERGTYYWSVQAVDQSYLGSSFAAEQRFDIGEFAASGNINLPPITKGEVAWGDYDSDNDLDILLTGNNVSAIYRNDGNGAFVDFGANFPGMTDSHCAWGDYDRDGDLDVLISGLTSVSRYSRIYRNDGTKFTDIFAGLTDCSKGDVVWGDYDLDGDLDALVTGETNSGRVANLYRNDGGDNFTWVDAGFTGVSESSAAWGDYDNDGDQDLLLSGTTNGSVTGGLTHLYQNDGLGNFISVSTSLDNISSGSVSWGDFNQDGFLDVLMTGWSSGAGYPRMAKIYQNNTTGDFTNISADLEPVLYASSAWGDYDNDGDLDILLTGYELFNAGVAIIYENDNSTFKKLQDLPDLVYRGSVAWGDFDNDMDLDILVAGEVNSPNPPVTKIYYNNTANKNMKPTTPQGLDTVGGDNTIELSWSKATDNETAQNGLTYNVLIKPVILAGMQNVGGISKVTDSPEVGAQPQIGNVNHNTSISIKNLFPGIYTWQVQAVDNGFAVSDFSEPREFEADLALPVELTTFEASIQNNQAQLKWETATETNNYGFHVQRKLASATDWETLDFVQGKGTTTEPQHYRYGDDISRIKYQSQEINYRLKQTDTDGSFEYSSEISVEIKPQEFRLSQNYPNPFNPTTQIEYELPQDSKVVLKIYNMRGQEIRTLVDDLQNSGFKSVTWNARDNEGHKVSSGIYLYSVQMGEQRFSRKMVLIE